MSTPDLLTIIASLPTDIPTSEIFISDAEIDAVEDSFEKWLATGPILDFETMMEVHTITQNAIEVVQSVVDGFVLGLKNSTKSLDVEAVFNCFLMEFAVQSALREGADGAQIRKLASAIRKIRREEQSLELLKLEPHLKDIRLDFNLQPGFQTQEA